MPAPLLVVSHRSGEEMETAAQARALMPAARVVHGWKGFIHRLTAMRYVERGTPVVLLENGRGLPPRPYVRMLERVGLGLGALNVQTAGAGPSWFSAVAPGMWRLDQLHNDWPFEIYAEQHAARVPFTGQWATEMKKTVLLVGDRLSTTGKRSSLPDWAFISAVASGCSVWLSEQLEQARISEADLCWTNTTTRAGTEVDLTAINAAPFLRVIAMGREAKKALEEAGVKHSVSYHPQYWKRFHTAEPYYLLNLIKAAL